MRHRHRAKFSAFKYYYIYLVQGKEAAQRYEDRLIYWEGILDNIGFKPTQEFPMVPNENLYYFLICMNDLLLICKSEEERIITLYTVVKLMSNAQLEYIRWCIHLNRKMFTFKGKEWCLDKYLIPHS